MDKYEYRLKAEEIIKLGRKRQYQAAAKIADEILWEKVKNIQMLCTVSEIYEKIGRYEDSKEVMLLAYRRSPNSKAVVCKLIELYINLKDYKEAMGYYHEFVQLAPNDSYALILKYKLYKARGAKLETQIAILEEFKSRDYDEEWILELAYLYQQAREIERCVELCDEIDLWFNDGPTVMMALELKMMYEPLTMQQEQKLYDYREQQRLAGVVQATEPVVEEQVAEPVEEQSYGGAVAMEAPVADTFAPEAPVQAGFSILPKGEVVKGDAEEFAFELPDGVDQIELPPREEPVKEPEVAKELTFESEERQNYVNPQVLPEEPEDEGMDEEEIHRQPAEDDDLEELSYVRRQTKPMRPAESEGDKIIGLFGKVMSHLKMEDNDYDDDFDDDYEDDDYGYEEDPMVTRGLTGQYEKIVIDDDDDEDDPLNMRMTSPIPAVADEDEEDYEYTFGEDDEYEEYEEYEEEEVIEEPQQNRGSKRFRFFRNTMEDDEMFEEEEEEAEEEIQIAPIHEEVIPLSYAAKYDTLNLQKELAKSIQQLMDATEKESVDSTLENVKKLVEASNIPELTETMRFRTNRGTMLNNVAKRQAERLQQSKHIEEVVKHNAENTDYEPKADATVFMADARPKPAAELAIKLKPKEEERVPIEQILTQEDDGQLTLVMPEEEEMLEKQITGQLNIEDVLREWEKQELLSESDREKRALEEARKRAIEETQGIMAEIMGLLKDVIPKIGSIKDGEDKMAVLAAALEKVQQSLPYAQGMMEAEEGKVAAEAIEAACAEAVMELELLENDKKGAEPEDQVEEAAEEQAEDTDVEATEEVAEEQAEVAEEEAAEEEAEEQAEDADTEDSEEDVIDSLEKKIEEALPEEIRALVEMEETEEAEEEESEEEVEDEVEEEPEEDMTDDESEEESEDDVWEDTDEPAADEETDDQIEELIATALEEEEASSATSEESEEEESEEEVEEESEEESEEAEETEETEESDESADTESEQKPEEEEELSEEQNDIMAYFMAVKSVKPLLKRVVKNTEKKLDHMIITGDTGSGKTSVAMRIIKASQVNKEDKIETIAKIKAGLLNQKDVETIFDKVDGGVLIIEQAGELSLATVTSMETLLGSQKYNVKIVLTDTKEAMDTLVKNAGGFISKISVKVDLPVYDNNELAEFARTYAQVNGYTFDGMATLALHSVIEFFQAEDHVTNLEDMKNIMDEAMERADRRSHKLFGKLFGKKNQDGIVLIESDFD